MERTTAQRGSFPAVAFATLALLSATSPLATDMYLPAFPGIAEDLGASAASVQFTLTTFLVGLAVGQLVIGPLSDQFGRRVPLLVGTSICVASSLLCMLAPSIELLMAARVAQGFCGAAGVVLARAIIVDRSSDRVETARYFQIMMTIGALAPILAPLIGVGVLTFTDWRGIFGILAFLSIVAIAGIALTLAESLPPERRSPGGIRSLFSNVATVIGNGRYLGYALTTGSTFMALFAYISSSPFVLQGVLGLSQTTYAIVFGANALGITVVGAISARVVRRFGPRRLAIGGLASLLVFTFLLVLCAALAAPTWLFLLVLFVSLASVGCIMGNSSALAISEVPETAGAGSAVLGALQFGLGALASSAVGLGGKDAATPMAVVMFVTTALAAICFGTTSKGTSVRQVRHE